MLKFIRSLLAGFLLLPLASAALAETGQELVENHCVSCHQSEVYTRDNRFVHSYDALKEQVRRCELNLGLTWFDDQVDAVSQHLNETYYNF